LDHRPVIFPIFCGQIGWKTDPIGLANDLVKRFADQVAKPMVSEGELSLQVFAQDILR